jgi:Mg2+-importing ATPase
VVRTGRSTDLGAVSHRLAGADVTTGFERGVTAFGWLLVRAMALLTTGIFVVNLVLDRPLVESFLFSVALAVGPHAADASGDRRGQPVERRQAHGG